MLLGVAVLQVEVLVFETGTDLLSADEIAQGGEPEHEAAGRLSMRDQLARRSPGARRARTRLSTAFIGDTSYPLRYARQRRVTSAVHSTRRRAATTRAPAHAALHTVRTTMRSSEGRLPPVPRRATGPLAPRRVIGRGPHSLPDFQRSPASGPPPTKVCQVPNEPVSVSGRVAVVPLSRRM